LSSIIWRSFTLGKQSRRLKYGVLHNSYRRTCHMIHLLNGSTSNATNNRYTIWLIFNFRAQLMAVDINFYTQETLTRNRPYCTSFRRRVSTCNHCTFTVLTSDSKSCNIHEKTHKIACTKIRREFLPRFFVAYSVWPAYNENPSPAFIGEQLNVDPVANLQQYRTTKVCG